MRKWISLLFSPLLISLIVPSIALADETPCDIKNCESLLNNASTIIVDMQKARTDSENRKLKCLQDCLEAHKKQCRDRSDCLKTDSMINQIKGLLKNGDAEQRTDSIKISTILKMDCEECKQTLNRYYVTPLKKVHVPPEKMNLNDLSYIWQNLYRLSRNDCWQDAENRATVAKLLRPHLLAPENFITAMMQMDPQDVDAINTNIESLTQDQRNRILQFLIDIAAKTERSPVWLDFFYHILSTEKPETLTRIKQLLDEFNTIRSDEEREIMIRNLRYLRFREIENLVKASAEMNIQEKKGGYVVRKHTLLPSNTCKEIPNINALLLSAMERRYNTIADRVEIGEFGSYDPLYDVKVGDISADAGAKASGLDKNLLYRISGTIKCEESCIRVYLSFIASSDRVMFADRVDIYPLQSEAEIRDMFEITIDAFHGFILSLTRLATTPDDIKHTEALLNRGVYVDPIFSKLAEPERARLKWIAVEGDGFWKNEKGNLDDHAAAIFSTDLRELVMEASKQRIPSSESLQALLRSSRSDGDGLLVAGQYQENVTEEYSSIKLLYYLYDSEYATQSIRFPSFPKTGASDRIRTIKARTVSVITDTLTGFLEGVSASEKEMLKEMAESVNKRFTTAELEKDASFYMKSFLMPGYVRSYHKTDPPAWVGAWNYSNYLLLGLSLASQMMFIQSDYEEDVFYQIGVAGMYLFAANGMAGVVDAKRYSPPQGQDHNDQRVRFSSQDKRIAVMLRINF